MKKILFLIPSFEHGGTNKSFSNILSLVDFVDAELNLFCIKNNYKGSYKEIFKSIKDINILKESKMLAGAFFTYDNNKNILRKIALFSCRVICKLFRRKFRCYALKRAAKKLSGQYDTVVALEEGITTFLASHIEAPYKISWVRCEYSRYLELTGLDERAQYESFNNIVCVSEASRNNFLNVFPQFSEKTIVIKNFQNEKKIIELSEKDEVCFDKNHFNIVSVGRLDIVKQFSAIPGIVDSIKQRGHSVTWYILGDGPERFEIEKEIKKYGLCNDVVLKGFVDNPYPYIKSADLVAVTSKSESFCNVIEESKILLTPVITTPFAASCELVESGINGVISDIENFSDSICNLITDKTKYISIKNMLKNSLYVSNVSVSKIRQLVLEHKIRKV